MSRRGTHKKSCLARLGMLGLALVVPSSALADGSPVEEVSESIRDAAVSNGDPAYGAGTDAVGDRLDPWPPYGVGNYRPASKGKFYGRLRSQFRYEKAEVPGPAKDDDLDFYQTLTLGTDGVGFDNLDTRFSGRWSKDLDGSRDPLTGNDFLIDSRDQRNRNNRQLFEIYQAYAKFRAVGDRVDITLGRQYVTEADWVQFDGVAVDAPRIAEFGGMALSVAGFAGRRVGFYGEFAEKGVAGGHVTLHVNDWLDMSVSDVASARNLLEFKVNAEPIEGLLISPNARMIDGELDRFRLDVDYWNDDLRLEVQFSAIRQLASSNGFEFGLASADRNFERIRLRLPEPSAYQQYQFSVYKELIEDLAGVQVGIIRQSYLRHRSQTGFEASYWEPWIAVDASPIDGLRLDAKFTYAGYHRPDVRQQVFEESQRGEGEESWFEVQLSGRYRVQDLLTVGGSYIYRQFQAHTSFERDQTFTQNSWRVFLQIDVPGVEGLSAQVEYRYDDDLNDPIDGIQSSEALWAYVEYSF